MKLLKTFCVAVLAAQPFVAAPSFALSTTPTFKSYDVHGAYNDIAYGNGRYVAVGEGGKIVTSTNGTTWSFSPTAMATIQAVVYNPANKLFYVMSIDSTGKNHDFYSSSDGSSWTKLSNVYSNGLGFRAVFSFANGKFFAGGANLIYTSSDAKTWTLWTQTTNSAVVMYYGKVVWGNGVYVVDAQDALDGTKGLTWTSTNGTSWQGVVGGGGEYDDPTTNLAFGNGGFMVLSHEWGATQSLVKQSTNGTTWTSYTGGPVGTPIYNNGWKVFSTGWESDGSIWTSSTGAAGTWTQTFSGYAIDPVTGMVSYPAALANVATNGTNYIGVGASGVMQTTSSLASWTVNNAAGVYFSPEPTRPDKWDGAYMEVVSNGTTLLATDGSVLKASTDGVTWKDITSGLPFPTYVYDPSYISYIKFQRLNYAGGYFYVTTNDQSSESFIARSKDLVNWQRAGGWSEGEPVYFASNSAGLTLGVSNRDYSACSIVGASTTSFVISEGGYFDVSPIGIACSGSRFVVVLADGQVRSSTNGLSWTAAGTVPAGATSIAYMNSKFIVATPSGIYTCSSTGTSWSKNSFSIPTTASKLSVANGKLFLTGDNGYVAYSSDASSWKVLTTGTTNKVYSVASNSSVYVAGTAALLNGVPNGTQKGTLLISK